MNGIVLKYLAGVADLARLDIEAAAITLRCEDGDIAAGYAGMYARGVRRGQGDAPDFSISVNAAQFKTMASMFDDDDTVVIRRDPEGLVMRSRSSNAQLRAWGDETDYPEFDRRNAELVARLPANTLISEIDAAQDFTGESLLRPALTGIRLDFESPHLLFTATDGFTSLYRASVDATVKGAGSIVVPAADFALGAKLIGDGDATIVKPKGENAVIIYNSHALFRSSLIALEWPNLDDVMATKLGARFQVDAAQVRNLVAGAKALGSEPDVLVKPQRGYVLFETSSESGGFTTASKGAIDFEMRFGADVLAKLVKLGSVLSFRAPAVNLKPTLVTSEHRSCWIMMRG